MNVLLKLFSDGSLNEFPLNRLECYGIRFYIGVIEIGETFDYLKGIRVWELTGKKAEKLFQIEFPEQIKDIVEILLRSSTSYGGELHRGDVLHGQHSNVPLLNNRFEERI